MTRVDKMMSNPWLMKLYMAKHLPMGLIAGLRVDYHDENEVRVSVPFGYLTKNPFRSMYFAVMAMAAELSTGLVALDATLSAGVPVSMLVLGMKAEFAKKARSRVVFSCKSGNKIRETVRASVMENEGRVVEVESVGLDRDGDVVARFWFTWTFKPKSGNRK